MNQSHHFDELMRKLPSLTTRFELLNHIITPFYPLFLCDHWVGNEVYLEDIPLPEGKNDILRTGDLSAIKDLDIVQCQPSYLPFFVHRLLPQIEAKIILITSGYHQPQVYRNTLTDRLLTHPKIALWVSQNPIYPESDRYKAFPYGICFLALPVYRRALLAGDTNKEPTIGHFFINKGNHPCRADFPDRPVLRRFDFYQQLKQHQYVLSPIGDRDDCYRHYEAIGLGTVPIANVGEQYRTIFGDSMCYAESVNEMLHWFETPNCPANEYKLPSRDLITTAYYRERFWRWVEAVREKNSLLF